MSDVTNRRTGAEKDGHKRAAVDVHDTFFELKDEDIVQPFESVAAGMPDRGNAGKSPFADMVLTPLHMISLLLSLLFVDQQQQKRHEADIRSWSQRPQPHQVQHDTTWQQSQDQVDWNKKRRSKTATKLELSDALDLRGRVLIGVILWSAIGMLVAVIATRKLYSWAYVTPQ